MLELLCGEEAYYYEVYQVPWHGRSSLFCVGAPRNLSESRYPKLILSGHAELDLVPSCYPEFQVGCRATALMYSLPVY